MDATEPRVDDADIAAVRARGEESLRAPRATAARYMQERERGEIDLDSGWSVQVPRVFSSRLAKASAQECAQIEILDSGLSLHWPAIDEDWYVPAQIEALTVRSAAWATR